MPEHPSHNLLHYCRWCVAEFVYDSNQSSTPHMRVTQHAYFAHKRRLAVACNRYCECRQQPEERAQNKRMYGPGVAPPSVSSIRAEDLGGTD